MGRVVRRGEVWLANLGDAGGREMRHVRPVVVLQADQGNRAGVTTIVAPLTSRHLDEIYPMEVLLLDALPSPSKVAVHHLRVIDQQRLIKRMTTLDYRAMRDIEERLKLILALPSA